MRVFEREIAGAHETILGGHDHAKLPEYSRFLPLAREHTVEIRVRLRNGVRSVKHEPRDVRVRCVRVDRIDVGRDHVPKGQSGRAKRNAYARPVCQRLTTVVILRYEDCLVDTR